MLVVASDLQLPTLFDGAHRLIRVEPHHLQDDGSEGGKANVANHVDRIGHIDCRDLIPYDLSTPEGAKAYLESGIWRERCFQYAELVVRALFAAHPV